MTNTTPRSIVDDINEQGRLGREALKQGDAARAEEHFLAAWDLVPEPRTSYDYGQVLSRGLVNFYRDTGQFEKAKRWVAVVRDAYGSQHDPSVEFLAGTVHYDAGELDEAFDRFDEIFKEFGQRPFQGARPDYLKFYKRRAAESKT
jgi:tetratricopeptide (TPR) repeat protein